MGARIISFEKAVEITDAFLGAEFLGGRHQRRVDMLEAL
jgi:ribose 5-phosphate isomerase B